LYISLDERSESRCSSIETGSDFQFQQLKTVGSVKGKKPNTVRVRLDNTLREELTLQYPLLKPPNPQFLGL